MRFIITAILESIFSCSHNLVTWSIYFMIIYLFFAVLLHIPRSSVCQTKQYVMISSNLYHCVCMSSYRYLLCMYTVYVCMCMSVYVCMNVYVCVNVCIYIHVCACLCVCLSVCVCLGGCICMYLS